MGLDFFEYFEIFDIFYWVFNIFYVIIVYEMFLLIIKDVVIFDKVIIEVMENYLRNSFFIVKVKICICIK